MSIDNNAIISDLNNCFVDAQSRMVDWAEALGEDMEGWTGYSFAECEECDRSYVVNSHMGQEEHRHLEPEWDDEDGEPVFNECMGTNYDEAHPMMNYFYPCRLDDLEEAAEAIAHLPLCVVEWADGETGFALTGGGMDLTWEIADAYISCGYLPPFQYTSLPDMSGKEREPRTQLILAACLKSATFQQIQAHRRGKDLESVRNSYATILGTK